MPMKSYDDGTIVHIDHAAGDEVALGQRVMVLAKKGEDPEEGRRRSLGGGAGAGRAASRQPALGREAGADGERPAAAHAGAGRHGQHGRRRRRPASRPMSDGPAPTAQGQPAGAEAGRGVAASTWPRCAARAPAAGSSAATSRHSSRANRSRRRHGRRAGAGHRGAGSRHRAAAPARASSARAAPLAAQRIPHSRMRKTIAQRMLQAKQAAPEIHLTVDIRADRLVAAREELNKRLAREGIKLSLGDFVTKAVALALRIHPGVNASFEPDAIVRHGEVNIGIAVALDEGLIVPVLHRADTLGLREIRVQSEALAAAARANTLTGEQLTGGTFTISNLGMYGIRQFDAILNMPEVGILAVGAAEKRPVVEGDRLVVGTVMTVTLTADHRAVDGAMAAEFLQTLKGLLEEPTSMLL